jgi:hypothetical protein
LAKWFGVGRTDTGSGGQERSATVGLHLCGLLGNLLGAASGSRAGDCVPSIGVEVLCSTGCCRCYTIRKRRCSNTLMKRRQSKPEAAISEEHTGAKVISVHSDISTKSREWLDVLVLDRNTEEE